MSLLSADYYVRSVDGIRIEALKEAKVELVLLDRDNTIVPYDTKEAPAEVCAWIESCQTAGIQLMFVSNNWAKNVRKEAEKFGVSWISKGLKPLPFVFWLALKRMNVTRSHAIMVGDQVFTDILGANLAGISTVLVEPQSCSDLAHTSVLRNIEKRLYAQRKAQEDISSFLS